MENIESDLTSSIQVLHIGPLPPPMGGVASALQMILQCPDLKSCKHEVFNTSEGRLTETVGRKALTAGRVWRRVRLALQIMRRVQRDRPDLVHFQLGSESMFDIIGDMLMLWAGRLGGRWVILHLHVDPALADLPNRTLFRQWLFRQLIRPARAIFVLTEGYRDHLLDCAIHQPVFVIPNLCDESLLTLPLERFKEHSTFTVVYIGRLTSAKGVFDLLRLAASIRDQYSSIRFQVAGLPSTSEEEQEIRRWIEQEQLTDVVTRVGLVTGTAKRDLFAQADILLIPSYGESFGITAIEAMAAGLPVLATRVGGLRSIVIEGETGYLVESGDIEGMRNKLIELACNVHLRSRMGCAGRERFVRHYASNVVGSDISQIYEQISGGA